VKKNTTVRFYLATSVLATATLLSAQQSDPSAAKAVNVTAEEVNDANVQLMRQDVRAERKKVVAANMPLTEAEAAKFWPVYDRYIAETVKVNDVRYAALKEYAKNYETTTAEQSETFIKRWLAFDQESTQLRLKFIPEFEKVISNQKTALFFQVDRRVSMMMELQRPRRFRC
jgi:transposase